MDENRENALAAYYGLILRNRGYSPQRAAEAVVRRYPEVRAQLEEKGLLKPLRGGLVRWTDPALAHLLKEIPE